MYTATTVALKAAYGVVVNNIDLVRIVPLVETWIAESEAYRDNVGTPDVLFAVDGKAWEWNRPGCGEGAQLLMVAVLAATGLALNMNLIQRAYYNGTVPAMPLSDTSVVSSEDTTLVSDSPVLLRCRWRCGPHPVLRLLHAVFLTCFSCPATSVVTAMSCPMTDRAVRTVWTGSIPMLPCPGNYGFHGAKACHLFQLDGMIYVSMTSIRMHDSPGFQSSPLYNQLHTLFVGNPPRPIVALGDAAYARTTHLVVTKTKAQINAMGLAARLLAKMVAEADNPVRVESELTFNKVRHLIPRRLHKPRHFGSLAADS